MSPPRLPLDAARVTTIPVAVEIRMQEFEKQAHHRQSIVEKRTAASPKGSPN